MSNRVFFFLLFFYLAHGIAQPVFSWAATLGNSFSNEAACSAVDNAGSIFCFGFFSGIIDLDPGTGTTNVTSASAHTPFCCKLSAVGNFLFGKKLSEKIQQINDAIIDKQGNIFFCGTFDSIADFNPDAGVDFFDASNGNLFVTKWNNAGQYLWTRQFGNNNDTCSAKALCVNDSGEVIITGFFSGAADFDPGPSFSVLTSEGKTDIFFLRFSPSGNFMTCGQIGGKNQACANDITCDKKNQLYITGKYRDTLHFFSGSSAYLFSSQNSSEDAFICKFKKDGDLDWMISISGSLYEEGTAISADDCGNVFVTGIFSDTAEFRSLQESYYFMADSLTDAYLVKLNSSGTLRWVKTIGGKGSDGGKDLSVNIVGDVFVSGIFEQELKEHPSATPLNFFSRGAADVFLLKYSSQGDLLCAGTVGGIDADTLAKLSLSKEDEIFLSGTYAQSADMDLSNDSSWVYSVGAADIFVSKSLPGTCCVSVSAPSNIQALPEIICQGQSTTLTISPGEKGSCPNWKWYENDCGGMPVGSGDTINISPWTSTSYFVRQEGPCDTSSCVETSVSVKSSPMAEMEVILQGECKGVALSIKNKSINAQSYLWQFSNGNFSLQENPPSQLFNFYSIAEVLLIASNNNGCSDTAYYKNQLQGFENYYTLVIPNVFSPNGDDVNDEFFITYSGGISACFRIEIFDRWGVSVFSSADPDFRWNGKTAYGNLATQGTYFYVAQVGEKKLRGFILLAE